MALATQCPHCSTTFRVASDQLKLRGGIVRCGTCQEIFDGTANLVDLDTLAAAKDAAAPYTTAPETVVPAQAGTPEPDDTVAAPHTTAPETVVPAQAGTQAEPADAAQEPLPAPSADTDFEPIYTLDFDSTFDPFGILPKAAPAEAADASNEPSGPPAQDAVPEPEPEPESAAAPELAPPQSEPALPDTAEPLIAPTPDLHVDEELVAVPLPDHDDITAPAAASIRPSDLHTPLLMRESAPSDQASSSAAKPRARLPEPKPGRRSKLTPTRIPAPKLRVPDIDEPEFVKRGRQQEQSGRKRRILMAAGSFLLLLALAVQAATTFRNVLAARFPAAKPALTAACSVLGCRVELPAQIDNLAVETGELTTLGAGSYSLSTLLRNQGDLVQAWPNIELALTDANDKPLLRRVFTPAEYLPQGVPPAAGFAARGEQPIKLYFQLDQLKPSGYHIAIFYP